RTGSILDFNNYPQEAIDNGCTVIFSDIVANSWFNYPTESYREGTKDEPDPRTFRQLELMLKAARFKNIFVHIWAWGDAQSGLTQVYNSGSINGYADKRLIRYIAARLGPIPNWSMGYGYDLQEWTSKEEIETWANYLNDHLGWTHILSARGIKSSIPNLINSYDGFGRDVALHTTEYGPIDYFEVLSDLTSDTLKPHLLEERHSYLRPSFNLDMEGTRRLMWWETIAGGMGGWFGFYDCIREPDILPCQDPNYTNFYPNPEQLRTHNTFWLNKNRLLFNTKANNNLSNGFSLITNDLQNIVAYKENTDSIKFSDEVDLTLAPIVAVDTKLEYSEINISQSIADKLWIAPYKSDWAIAIGNFENKFYSVPIDTIIISDTITQNSVTINYFNATQNFSHVEFTWSTFTENNISSFEIEKSSDKKNWQTIKSFQPVNDILKFNDYSFSEKLNDANLDNFYRLKVTFINNEIRYSEIISPEKIIEQIELLQNYPNPFNGDATIEFSLPNDIITNITVYNSIGEKIQTLVNGKLSSGYHKVFFKANNLPSGVYIYTLKAGYFFTQKKMILLK
ncbi:MAG: T9SS type A sorting domain-containing protein, partial [Ignavibacteriae bacterium]|nr:T9SS type A sorting domain-containing protein [Ignavibacteriota bacterium]